MMVYVCRFSEQCKALDRFTVEKILSGVFLVRCQDHTELLAEIHLLPDFLSKHPQVRGVLHLQEAEYGASVTIQGERENYEFVTTFK